MRISIVPERVGKIQSIVEVELEYDSLIVESRERSLYSHESYPAKNANS